MLCPCIPLIPSVANVLPFPYLSNEISRCRLGLCVAHTGATN